MGKRQNCGGGGGGGGKNWLNHLKIAHLFIYVNEIPQTPPPPPPPFEFRRLGEKAMT